MTVPDRLQRGIVLGLFISHLFSRYLSPSSYIVMKSTGVLDVARGVGLNTFSMRCVLVTTVHNSCPSIYFTGTCNQLTTRFARSPRFGTAATARAPEVRRPFWLPPPR